VDVVPEVAALYTGQTSVDVVPVVAALYTGQMSVDVVPVVAALYTHNQRNIEYKFIFTQETILNYAA
jgi:hypothetical protein